MRKGGCERLARRAHPPEARKRGVVRTDGPGAQAHSLHDCGHEGPRGQVYQPPTRATPAPPTPAPPRSFRPSVPLCPSVPRSLAPSVLLSPRQVFSSQRPGLQLAPTLWCASKARWRLPTRAWVRGRAGPGEAGACPAQARADRTGASDCWTAGGASRRAGRRTGRGCLRWGDGVGNSNRRLGRGGPAD